jgi:hypothetical protein
MWLALSDLALVTFVLFVVLEIANLCLDIPELLLTRSFAPGVREKRYETFNHRRHQSAL